MQEPLMTFSGRPGHGYLAAALLALGMTAWGANAATPPANEHARVYGIGLPATTAELPAGTLRSALEALPLPARERALGWLRNFSFPAQDVAALRVDGGGGVFYEDPVIAGADAADGTTAPAPAELTASDTFALHSRPGASRTVHLDMDGELLTGTMWNSTSGFTVLDMRPYDTDGDETSFSQSELNDIAEVWKRIAEDYAPYDIDVTTEAPPAYGPQVGHILVTRKADRSGNPIYVCDCGGVAYVGVWGRSDYTYYQPALVFLDGVTGPHNVSEAGAHELGHNLSLSHDGTATSGYFVGHGSGYTSWAPIMGAGYYRQVTQWSKGEYAGANNTQDDLAIIGDHLGFRPDDHEDVNFALASPLVRSDATTISATNPVTDPDNVHPENKGVIEDRTDVDLFYVDTGAGLLDLTVTPAWIDYYTAQTNRGMNLDVRATLYDEGGTELARSDPADDTYARITLDVAGGRYLLAVEGVGAGDPLTDGYSDYASLGRYFINGTVPADTVATQPPTAPTDLLALPSGDNGILLTWTDPASTPETNEDGYRVLRQKDAGAVEIIDIPRDSDSFADNNLASGTYVYQLELYNAAGTTQSNVTQPVTITTPAFAVATGETTLKGAILSGSYRDTTVPEGSEVLTELHQGGKPSNRVSALEHEWTLTGVTPGAEVILTVDVQAPTNSEGDDFLFEYAVNDGPFEPFATLVNGTGRQLLSTYLPGIATGTVRVRVTDTDRTAGRSAADTVEVFSIVITSSGDPADQVPVLTIVEPVDGSLAMLGAEVVLSATAADYEDGDLSREVGWSSNLDGNLGVGATLRTTGLSLGTHQLTASVSDSANNLGQAGVTLTVTDQVPPSQASVAALEGTSRTAPGHKWVADVAIEVRDDQGGLVPDATVTGTWSDGATGSDSCLTDAFGRCTLSKGGLKTTVTSVTLTVTDIGHAVLGYDPGGVSSVTVAAP